MKATVSFLGLLIVLLGTNFVCFGAEACPEVILLTIHNGKASGFIFESANTPLVRTALRDDTLNVDIQREFQGKGTLDFTIPQKATKIRLFECDYILPPAEYTAYFRSVSLIDICPPWWRFGDKEEVQRAMMLISFSPGQKAFETQLWYFGRSGDEVWKNKKNISCIIAEDGQIFDVLDADEQVHQAPGTHYWRSKTFRNQNGTLQVHLQTTGKYYKVYKEEDASLTLSKLPKVDMLPYTLLFLNQPYKEQYLAEHQSDKIAVKKSVEEFRSLVAKCKLLHCGMTPEATAAVLGKPDNYHAHGPTGPHKKAYAYADYYFLYENAANRKNLMITLRFKMDVNKNPLLEDVY